VGYGAAASALIDLQKVAAIAQTAGDYKALVCVFLYGGNDSNNLIVPRSGADYSVYAAARANLAVQPTSLLPIAPLNADGREFGLHPAMPELQSLFAQRQAAVVCNVGPLAAPITRAQFMQGGASVPPNLFSHDDQQVQWQTSIADGSASTGWGGRTADLLRSLNDNAVVSMAISLAGRNVFQTGRDVFQYQVSPSGISSLDGYQGTGGRDAESQAFDQMLGLSPGNVLERAYRGTLARVIDNERRLREALESAPILNTVFPDSWLGQQLGAIARLVAIRTALGHRRQIFFCAVGGYDTHGGQLQSHPQLLSELSQALGAFHAATVELGVPNQVTTFTASDFGRTLVSNGTGSDHGWGGHHLVVGGAVRGARLYGQFPVLVVGGPDDTSDGRWIPTTSVDEYAAALARWFGVSASDLRLVFPNLGRFASANLDFMMI
jgi:uncharacterized protein (DUF1501 family)